ncbi:MAG: transglycosylase domain-containing protein [Myxococcales bacterium]|nr:transglycosylase domain-containing protein [Myxococcales bacterium]
MSASNKRRIWPWLIGAGGLLLAAGGVAVATYPSWAGGYLEGELVRRLQGRTGGEVKLGALELGYGHATLRDLDIVDDAGAHVNVEQIDVELNGGALWFGRVEVTGVAARGGTIACALDDCEALAGRVLKRERDDGDKGGGGRLRVKAKTVTLQDVALDVTAGAHAVKGSLDAALTLETRRLELTLKDADATLEDGKHHVQGEFSAGLELDGEAVDITLRHVSAELARGARPLRASKLATRVVLSARDDGARAPVFPLTLEIEGAGTRVTPKISVAGVRGAVTIEDERLRELTVELAGGFSDSENDSGEVPKLWSLKGPVRRDLTSGSLSLEMSAFELGKIPQVLTRLPVKDSEKATVGGKLDVTFADGKAELAGDLEVAGINVAHRLLARRVVPDLGFSLAFKAEVDPGASAVEIQEATIERGGVQLQVRGTLVHPPERAGRRYKLHFEVPKVACQDVLNALPYELVPGLDGFKLGGQFSAAVDADVDYADLEALKLDGSVGLSGCKVLSTPPLMAVSRLSGPFVHRTVMRTGAIKTVELRPGSGTFTPLAEINYLDNAVRTTEDGGFWRHKGFLPSQFEKALRRNLDAGEIRLGASTITMQMVKNTFLSHERTLSRKLQEMFLTWYVEQALPKARILEIYFNIIEFGPGVYGVTRAARHYFGKSPSELNPKEAMYLALMLPSPVRRHDSWCEGGLTPRMQTKLDRYFEIMAKRGRIDDALYQEFKDVPIVLDTSELTVSTDECKAEIRRIMAGTQTQRAATGLLASAADFELPELFEGPSGDDAPDDDDDREDGGDAGDDPADGASEDKPAMDVDDMLFDRG